MSNLPLGSEFDKNAPWNIETAPQKEVEVEVETTYVRKVKVLVDEDSNQFQLEDAVKYQILLPLDFIDNLSHISPEVKEIVEVLKYGKEIQEWKEKEIIVNQI